MSSRKRLDALKLSALAIAAAAAIAPMAYSGGRAAIVNKVTAPTAKTSQVAQDETADRFIVTYASTASAKANAAAFQSKLGAASKAAGTTVRMARSLSTGAGLIRTDRKLDRDEAKAMMIELLKDPNVLAVEVDPAAIAARRAPQCEGPSRGGTPRAATADRPPARQGMSGPAPASSAPACCEPWPGAVTAGGDSTV